MLVLEDRPIPKDAKIDENEIIWEYDYVRGVWFYSCWNKIQLVENAENGEDLYD